MATTLSATIKQAIAATYTKSGDFGDTTKSLNYPKSTAFTSGTGANQADLLYDVYRTLGATSIEELDLAGALVDEFGSTLTFARLKYAYLENPSTFHSIVVGGGTAAQFVGWFGGTAHTEEVRGGGIMEHLAPDATAWPIGAGSSDKLLIRNNSAGSITYRIVLMGCSA